MKGLKKVLSIILAIMMVVTIVPITVTAATSGTCGENLTWVYDSSTHTLTISGTGEMNNYSTDGHPWEDYENNITSVVIDDGVASIGYESFYDCTNLTNITIPDSIESIGYDAFYNTAYYNNTSNWENDVLYIGKYLIKATNISGNYEIKAGTLTIADQAFYQCSKLKSITIPDSVTSIGELAFCYCTGLTSVAIPDSVTSIGDGAFDSCRRLISVTIGDNVTSIGYDAFYNTAYYNNICNGESDVIYIGNYLIEANTSISGDYKIKDGTTTIAENAFSDCTCLTSVTLPDSITSIDSWVFSGCTSLTSVTIPDSVTSIGYSAFMDCTRLTSITIPDSVTSIDAYAFVNCTSLEELIMPASAKICNGSTWRGLNTNIKKVILTKGTGTMRDYGNDASECASNTYYQHTPWYYNRFICTEIIIKDGVKNIGTFAFVNCTKLGSITIPNSVTSIGNYAFGYCTGLTSVIIPDSVTSIGHYAFDNCTSLTDVYYSGSEYEWNKISIGLNNEYLTNATIHYVSTEYIESKMMIDSMPKLSDTDARTFLGFIYGKMDEFATADLESDIQYQLLTGTLPATKSIDEIKAIIDSFSLVVQEEIETHVCDSKYKSNYFLNSLIGRLENEVAGLKTTDQQIISEYTSATSKYLEEGLTDLFAGAVGSITGIHIPESTLLDCKNIISGIDTIASIPSKLNEFFNRVYMVSDIFVIIANHEKAGRYSYFSSYLNIRPTLDRDEYSWYYDMLFNSIRTDYFASEVFDWITPITGKDSWSNHRDDIERYAEFMLSLTQINQQDFHNYKITKHSPTCIEEGYTEYDCTYCDYYFIDNIVEPLGHKYAKTIIAPTCEEQGYALYQCENCTDSYKDNYKGASGHSVRTKTTVSPTCTTDGYIMNICKCGYAWQSDVTSALQHNYQQTIIEETETKQGYTVNKCVNCNDSYNSNYTNPTGHEYTVTTIAATCEQDGSITHTCDCGDSYSEGITATGHKYVLDSYEASSCTTEGSKKYKCINCDSTYTEAEEMLEHDYLYKTEFIDPTCEEQGYSINYCYCGDTSLTDYVDALGHSYIVVETVEATCTFEGANTLECELCGETTAETIPALGDGHAYELIKSSELTCETSQYELYECTICKTQKYENAIALTGHTYELNDSKEPVCTVCGKCRYNTESMSSQIRFNRNEDGFYAGTFDVRTRAMIFDEAFKELIGVTNTEAIKNIDKIGFVYTLDSEDFSVTSAQAVAQGETVVGYVDAPVNYIQDADGYYMFTCLVTDIPENDRNYTLTAYAYICVDGKWYFSETPMNADFNLLYETYYPVACERNGW